MTNKQMAKICSYNFDKKSCEIQEKKRLLEIFDKNVEKFTFLGIILPCISFLLIFLITTLVMFHMQIKGNFISDNFNLFMSFLFISIFFLVLGLILLYKWVIKKEKCYLTLYYGAYYYKHISNEKYNNICNNLNERC